LARYFREDHTPNVKSKMIAVLMPVNAISISMCDLVSKAAFYLDCIRRQAWRGHDGITY